MMDLFRATAATALLGFLALAPARAQLAPPTVGSVEVQASHGAATDVLPLVVDQEPPTIEVTSPAEGSVVAGNAVAVTGTVSDRLSPFFPDLDGSPLFGRVLYRVRDASGAPLDSGSVPLVEGRFTASDVLLGEGEHTIELQAVDSAGQVATAETEITSDPDAPAVTLLFPLDGEALVAEETGVTLNFAAPTTLVSVNGEADGRELPAGLARDLLTLPLELGPNPVALDFTSGGRAFSLAFTVFRVESRGPLQIDAPTDGSFAKEEVVTVTGTVPRGTPLVRVAGETASLGADLASFAAEAPLEEGENTIRAVAAPFGQSDTVEVTLDTRPPQLVSLLPGDGTVTEDPSVGFAGRTTERGRVELVGPSGEASAPIQARRVFDVPQPIFGPPILEYFFELPALALQDGENPIELRLVDRAGNETVETLSVIRSETALRVASPAEGTSFPGLTADLVLDVFADVTVESVFSAGRRLPDRSGLSLGAGASPPGQFTLSDVPLAPGSTELRIVYRRDATGAQEVLRHRLESTATAGATVAGTVTDEATGEPLEGALVSVVVDGTEHVVPTGPEGGFSVPVPPGEVVVQVEREGFLEAEARGRVATGETLVADAGLFPWDTPASELPPQEGEPSDDPVTTLVGSATKRASGEPLAGVLVTATAEDGSTVDAITDASGDYRIEGVPSGELQVDAVLAGYFPQIFESTTSGSTQLNVDFRFEPLPEAVTLVGTVLDETTGEAIPALGVEVLGTSLRAKTDDEGRFVIDGFPADEERALRFRRPGFRTALTSVRLVPQPGGAPSTRTFRIPVDEGTAPLLVVSPDAEGRVLQRYAGAPLSGASLEAVPTDGGDAVTAAAESDGSFVLPGLELGTFYEVTASAPGHADATRRVLVQPNAGDSFTFRLRSTEMGAVAGAVHAADTGEPLSLAGLRVPGAPPLRTATGPEGQFTLPIPPGTYELVARHPAYVERSLGSVTVEPGETVSVTADLEPAPTTGELEGSVTEAATGDPVAGATLELPDGRTATTDAEGRYTLSSVPAGLVELAIEAPGFAPTMRTAAVAADPRPGEPAVATADFALTADGSAPPRASQVVQAKEGAIVGDREGRLAVAIPAWSLSGDARVTVRPAPTPTVASGDLLSMEPALDAGAVRALGREMEIFVEPLEDGAPVPTLEGPAILLSRYDAAELEAQGLAARSIAPYFYDGKDWTLLRRAPHIRVVDTTNRVVLTGLTFAETETAARVSAPLGVRNALRLAGVDASEFLSTGNIYRFVTGSLPPPPIRPFSGLKDYLGTFEGTPQEINANARPLLVVHGWDFASITENSDPLRDPIDPLAGDARYAGILRDIAEATTGVYRPIFATYNTRAGVRENGTRIGRKLFRRMLEDVPNPIRGNAAPGETGTFKSIDAFGFSMGSLTTRALRCGPGVSATQGSKLAPPVRALVTMGGPHHGGLQRMAAALEEIIRIKVLGLTQSLFISPREYIDRWSPGTADLLDYEDIDDNPTLFTMNESNGLCAPRERIALIGGNDSGDVPPSLPDSFPDVLAGIDFVGELPNDSVVPLRSAHAEKPSGATVPTLANKVAAKTVQDFNHFDVGKRPDHPKVDPARAQPISEFIQTDILPHLSDWTVVEKRAPSDEEPPPPFEPPTLAEPGVLRFGGVDVHFNAQNDETGAVAVVFYGQDVQGNWHILAGASPETREPSLFRMIDGNSLEEDPAEFPADTIEIPRIDPQNPATEIVDANILVVDLKDASSEVPPDPTEVRFRIPSDSP